MVIKRTPFDLLHYNFDASLCFEYFLDLDDTGVGNHLENLQLRLSEEHVLRIIRIFYNMLNGYYLKRVFVLTLVYSRVLTSTYLIPLKILALKFDVV